MTPPCYDTRLHLTIIVFGSPKILFRAPNSTFPREIPVYITILIDVNTAETYDRDTDREK